VPANNALASRELDLTPVDNHRLANLCGVLDENLKQIEDTLSITIHRRGEHFSLLGQPDQTAIAAEAIKKFYRSAKRNLSQQEIMLGLRDLSGDAERNDDKHASPILLSRRPDLRGRTDRQVAYIRNIQEHVITFGVGPAGTGKTYLAVAAAVNALERDEVKRIVLVRPAVEAGEKLGFLPGDLSQKVDPYLRPLYDALYDLMGYDKVTKLFERSIIEVAPLAYMRGRTLNNAFIILDEAQNTTPEQMKMFLTRIGFGTKAVITGDVTQIDLHRGQKSGLIDARNVLQKVEGIAFTIFQSEDVVRHPLVQSIVNAYERYTRLAD
jgi:phosphate starvation-inducible PhoH-like protein